MSKVLVLNRMNNMGDAMCQMRGLKEYKELHPELSLDFATCFYLHWIMANHTDIFDNVIYEEDINGFAAGATSKGYDETIEFTVDWGKAITEGILKSWSETTLHLTPSTDKPYFNLTEEEKITALNCYRQIMYKNYSIESENVPRFRKSVIFQPEAVSDPRRGFLREDWEKAINLFPDDVAVIYFCPINRFFEAQEAPISQKPNFIMLPGFPVGTSAAMMQLVDCVFTVHSGTVMLAHAVNAQNIIHINFLESSGYGILRVEDGENVDITSNQQVDWDLLQGLVNKYLGE